MEALSILPRVSFRLNHDLENPGALSKDKKIQIANFCTVDFALQAGIIIPVPIFSFGSEQ
jgi:hypothetical protein